LGGKAIVSSRLFGKAVAGASAGNRSRESFVPRNAVAPRKMGMVAKTVQKVAKVRGRGNFKFSLIRPRKAPVLLPEQIPAPSDEGPRPHPLEPLADDKLAYTPHQRGIQAQRRWQHDQFDGPPTVGSAVFVRGLPSRATAQQVGGLFSSAGHVASVQVDAGPIRTATVGFVRRDAASEAERRFHGQWFQGSQLKVSVKGGQSSLGLGVDDEEFWRRELRDMQLQSRGMPERTVAAASRDTGRPVSGGKPASTGRQVRGRGPCVFDSSAADRQLELRDMQLQSRGMSERTVAAASSDSGRPVSAGKPASRGRQVRGRGPCVFDSSAADRQLRQAASAVSATSRGAVHKSRGLRHSLPYIEQRAARQVLVRNH